MMDITVTEVSPMRTSDDGDHSYRGESDAYQRWWRSQLEVSAMHPTIVKITVTEVSPCVPSMVEITVRGESDAYQRWWRYISKFFT